jgi:hypothetical protein
MIGGILNSFDSRRFEGLIGIGELFDTLICRFFCDRKGLRISGLAGAAGTDLSRIVAEFIEPGLLVALSFVRSLISFF